MELSTAYFFASLVLLATLWQTIGPRIGATLRAIVCGVVVMVIGNMLAQHNNLWLIPREPILQGMGFPLADLFLMAGMVINSLGFYHYFNRRSQRDT